MICYELKINSCFLKTGCIPCMLYIASGSSADWALGEAGIQFSISMELRDTGKRFKIFVSTIVVTLFEVSK